MPGGFIAASRDSIKEYLNEIPLYRHRRSRHSTCTVLSIHCISESQLSTGDRRASSMDCDEAVLVVESLTIDTIMIPHLIDVYNLRFEVAVSWDD